MKEDKKLLYVLIVFIISVAALTGLNMRSEKNTIKLETYVTSMTEISQQTETYTVTLCFNINNVTKEELMRIDGIGEKTAEKIIAYRILNNGFNNLEELKSIDSIGTKTYALLCRYLYIPQQDTTITAQTDITSDSISYETVSTSLPETTTATTSASETTTAVLYPLDINTATKEELMTIKGIGEVKAQAIIAYRNSQGIFHSIDELLEVNGIGNKTLEEIKKYAFCYETPVIQTETTFDTQIPHVLHTTTETYTETTTEAITETSCETTSETQAEREIPETVNLNTASREKLISCLEISQETADKILYHREQVGFKSIYELLYFISNNKFNEISDRVTV